MNKTNVVLGRFAPFHLGHQWITKAMVDEAKPCLVMVGSSDSLNERTPFTYEQRQAMIRAVFSKIEVLPLPDVKSALEHYDGTTNDKWLDSISAIERRLKTKFVFWGGSVEDLEILSQRFETKVALDRFNAPLEVNSATDVREALERNDLSKLEKFLDHKIVGLAIKYYEEFKKSY